MANVVPLKADVDEETVAALRSALDYAERGDLTGVCIIGELRGGEVYNSGTFEDGVTLLGYLAHMQYHISATMRGNGD